MVGAPLHPAMRGSAARLLLRGATLLMAATGLGFAGFSSFWPLMMVAFELLPSE
jgi:hypothetical protein